MIEKDTRIEISIQQMQIILYQDATSFNITMTS